MSPIHGDAPVRRRRRRRGRRRTIGPVDGAPSRAATLRDVAAAAGVSAKTVSRVVNGDPAVAAGTRERVQRAVDDLRYAPDPLARSLRSGHDATIAVVVDAVSDPFFAEVVGAIEEVATAEGCSCIVASTQRSPAREREVVRALLQRRVRGLILAPLLDDLGWLGAAGVPVVFVDRAPVGVEGDVVMVDDVGGAQQAVAHLVAHGHRRIAAVASLPQVATTLARLDGFTKALAEAGLAQDPALVRATCAADEDAVAATAELLALPNPPTAVFVANARYTTGVVRHLHASGRTDVAVVGFGDVPMGEVLVPGVSVVDHSPRQIGRRAAARLVHRIGEGARAPADPPVTELVPLCLVPRGSGELAPPGGAGA